MLTPDELDPILMNPKRLSIMTILYVLGPKRMADLIRYLGITWGDLSTNIRRLETAGYIKKKRIFTITGEKVIIYITDKGILAYRNLLRKLEDLTKIVREHNSKNQSPPVKIKGSD